MGHRRELVEALLAIATLQEASNHRLDEGLGLAHDDRVGERSERQRIGEGQRAPARMKE